MDRRVRPGDDKWKMLARGGPPASRAPMSNDSPPDRDPALGLSGEALARPVLAPHLLEIVEAADLGPEDVHDHVAGVDQDPVAGGQTLDPRRPETSGFQHLEHALGDRA